MTCHSSAAICMSPDALLNCVSPISRCFLTLLVKRKRVICTSQLAEQLELGL